VKRLALAATLCILAHAAAAEPPLAESDAAEAAPAATPDAQQQAPAPPLFLASTSSSGEAAQLFAKTPYRARRAQAFLESGLSLFARSDEFNYGRDATLYDLEGGAALRLSGPLHLSAGYRLLGHLSAADLSSGSVDLGMAAPFLRLGLDF
jgi:hypothetical protein